jgi:hypothetical protein
VSWYETALFVTLLLVSAALFWRRLSPVIGIVRASKPDSGFVWCSTAQRVRTFVWEVLFQGKVIRERPLPGIAHAFVFWGFLAFSVVTLDHLAAGVHLDLMRPDGAFGRVYFAFAGLFAAAVSVSIVGLFVRRFLVRPRWLGEISKESGIIAFLILTLMLTFLAAWLWLPEDSVAGRLTWWAHTAALICISC